MKEKIFYGIKKKLPTSKLHIQFDGFESLQNDFNQIVFEKESGDIAFETITSDKIEGDGYHLLVTEEKILIEASCERGIGYGLFELNRLIKDSTIPLIEITNIPEIDHRGVIEGFYGVPWTDENRMDLFHFLFTHQMNLYIYAPKDDRYHRKEWRKPYPEKEIESLKRYIAESKK